MAENGETLNFWRGIRRMGRVGWPSHDLWNQTKILKILDFDFWPHPATENGTHPPPKSHDSSGFSFGGSKGHFRVETQELPATNFRDGHFLGVFGWEMGGFFGFVRRSIYQISFLGRLSMDKSLFAFFCVLFWRRLGIFDFCWKKGWKAKHEVGRNGKLI